MVEPRRSSRRGSGSRRQIGPTRAAKPHRAPPAHRARGSPSSRRLERPADAVTMLKRPPTRIELKPEDREEYQRHKRGAAAHAGRRRREGEEGRRQGRAPRPEGGALIGATPNPRCASHATAAAARARTGAPHTRQRMRTLESDPAGSTINAPRSKGGDTHHSTTSLSPDARPSTPSHRPNTLHRAPRTTAQCSMAFACDGHFWPWSRAVKWTQRAWSHT